MYPVALHSLCVGGSVAPTPHSSMSFTIELMLFMGVMLCYVYTVSLYVLVVLWEYLGLLSYLLIQHWGCRSMATLSSSRSILYNKVLDVLVLTLSTSAPLIPHTMDPRRRSIGLVS